MNRTASKALDNMTPLQALTGIKPFVKHLKPFGCLVYTHVAKAYRLGNKLAPRGVPCLLMSYDGDEQRGYRVLNLLTGKFETAREGRFVEDKTVDASYVTRALDIGHRRATTTLKKNIPYVPLPLSDHDDECVPLVRAKHHDEDRAQGSDDEDHGSTRSSDSNASAPSDDYDSDNHEHRHSKKRK